MTNHITYDKKVKTLANKKSLHLAYACFAEIYAPTGLALILIVVGFSFNTMLTSYGNAKRDAKIEGLENRNTWLNFLEDLNGEAIISSPVFGERKTGTNGKICTKAAHCKEIYKMIVW